MINDIVTVKEEIFKNSTTVECKLPITQEEAESVVNLTANSEIGLVTVDDGFITYNGKTVFTLLYIQDGVLKKCEHGVEFSFKVDVPCVKKGSTVRVSLKTNNEKVSVTNGIVSASAVINVLGVVVCSSVTELESNIDGYLCKKEEYKTYNEISCLTKSVVIEDEFELNYAVKDVLCHDERVTVKSVQSGIGAVTVDGEIEVTAYLNKLDNDDIVKERKTIPFSVEIENEEFYPSCMPYADVLVKTSYLKAYVDEGKNKSDFSIEANLSVTVTCVENVNYTVVLDAYSADSELKLTKANVNFTEFLRVLTAENQINGDISYEITKNDRLIATVGVKIEGEEYDYSNDTLTANGVVSVVAVLSTENGIKPVELTCPYSVSLLLNGNAYTGARTTIKNFEVRLTPSGFAYAYTVVVTANDLNVKTVNLVNAVEVIGEKQKNDSAISVYFANANETTWDACKTLGVSEEEILRFNENLPNEFTGEERIIIFREEK